jgi:hypothetical protein
MFEFLVEKEETKRTLSEAERSKIASDVGDLFKTWDDARSKQKNIADKLRPEIYLDEREIGEKNKKKEWKSDVHLNKIYSLNQTQQAYVWDNIYSNVEHLFDVEGTDEESQKTASLQKTNIVNLLSKIGIQRKLDKAIEYLGAVGEMCLFVGWKTQYKQIRRKLDFADNPLFKTQSYGIYNKEIYNGVNVEVIDPMNIVWDTKVDPEEVDRFDACGKIIKSFETYDSVATNKLYSLKKSELDELRKALNTKNTEETETSSDKTDLETDGNRVEVLNYWGNYTLEDGTVLRNWNIVVIGRKYVALFEHNRWVINPIINCAILRDSKNKRGIPELWSIYELCKEQEKKVNLQNDAQALSLNPPAYAPKGFFKENIVEIEPGKVVDYDIKLEDPNSIIKMVFPLISNEAIIQYYDSTASVVSGIFPNMQGQEETGKTTATEINVKVQGQTTRLSKLLDAIKQNGIVPLIEKIAELDANISQGDSVIYADVEGQKVAQVIGDTVRLGNYEYKYTDNSGIQKKLTLNKTLTEILTPVWNDPQIALDKAQLIIDALTNAGVENAEKYVQQAQPQINQGIEYGQAQVSPI